MRKSKAYLLVILAAVLWGTIGLFVRFLSGTGLTDPQLIAFRSWVSALVMFVWLALRDPGALSIRPRDWWMFAGTGIISFVLFGLCYFRALQLTTLSTAAVLLYTAPIFVALLSAWLFHERFAARTGFALAMAFGGCVLVSGPAGGSSWLGIVLGLLSGFFYSLYSIFGKYALKRYSSATVTLYTFIFASLGITPFANLPALAGIAWTPSLMVVLLAFAGLSGAAAYLLYTKGLSGLPATDAAIAAIMEPVVASLAGLIAFGETLSLPGLAGVALVLGAILVLNLPSHRQGRTP